MKRTFLGAMLLLNSVVLLGQLWPSGAPPFARTVNILFLSVSLVTFALQLRAPRKDADAAR